MTTPSKILGDCAMPDCGKPAHAKGLCKRHYQQQWATGSPEIRRPNPRGTPVERFWRHVDRGAEDACWPWTGRRDKDGYGALTIRSGEVVRAHRFSYELHRGTLPVGDLVRHRCNNPPCCNPAHLVPGDQVANMRDRSDAGRAPAGETHPNAKFSTATVAAVRAASGTYAEIAARFGMSASQVGNVKRGDQRRDAMPPPPGAGKLATIAAGDAG